MKRVLFAVLVILTFAGLAGAVDIWMDVDTAIAECPVNLMPLVASADFVTIDADVNYDVTGLALIWHFVTTAGAYTQTAVTPTNTGGNYDWIEQGNGYFTIEIPASGGASINNDTEGHGWFSGSATGILPWRGPIIGFRSANKNDLEIDDTAAGTNQDDFFDGTGYAGGTSLLHIDVEEWLAATPVALADTADLQATNQAAMTAQGFTEARAAYLDNINNAALATTAAQTGDSYAQIGVAGAGLTAIPGLTLSAEAIDTLLNEVVKGAHDAYGTIGWYLKSILGGQ